MARDGNRQNRNRGDGKKGGGKLRQRAVRDVQLQMQPQFDYNTAQLQQTQENALRLQQAAQSASGGAADAIAGIEQPKFGNIADQFTTQLNRLAPEFGGQGATVPYRETDIYGTREGQIGMPATEVAAANAVGGAIGQGTLGMLANDKSRFQMGQASAEREANVFGRNQQAAILQNMQDVLRQHENEQQNLMAQQPYQIKSRLDELKDQAIEQQLARSKMASDEAFNEYLMGSLEGMINTGRNRGPGGGGPGGGGPGGGGGAPGAPGNREPGGPPGSDREYDVIDQQKGLQGESPYGPGWRQAAVQDTRQADYLGALPGWVRYAFNHGGAQALEDPRRRRLYRTRLDDLLERFRQAPGPIQTGVNAPGVGFFS